jgi:uncharacterized lipoprotein YbaY
MFGSELPIFCYYSERGFTMRFVLRSLVLAMLIIAISGCNQFVDPDDPTYTTSVRTTITGRVIDEAGKSVAGALVRGHGASATTNANGVFVLQNVSVPSTRAVVLVTKNGYFTGARAAYPSANKITTMMLTLQEYKQTATVNSASGGRVSVGGASIDLPANGYVDAQGKAYFGTVSIAAKYLDPSSSTYYDVFSGDMAALRTDNSSVELTSFGVVRVLLKGAQGQPLNLAAGSSATINFPSAGATDAEIPLWHFDEQKGIWVEEGKAVNAGGRYIGTVTHFTDWNLDRPNSRVAILEGQVTCGENKPLAGIIVDIGQVSVVTDQDGMFRRRVPADLAFDIQVKAERNDGISSAAVNVGPIAQNQTLRREIAVSPCPTMIEAQMVDCNDAPIGGFLQVITPTGVKLASSTTGRMLVAVPAGVALTLEGYSVDGRTITSTPVAPIAAGTLSDAGKLKACGGVETSFIDITLPDNETVSYAALNSNGSKVAAITRQNDGKLSLLMYDTQTGAQDWRVALSASIQEPDNLLFVGADQRIAITTRYGTSLLDASTGSLVIGIKKDGRHFVTSDGASVYTMETTAPYNEFSKYDAQTGSFQGTRSYGSEPNRAAWFMGLQVDKYAIVRTYQPFSIMTVDPSTGDIVRTYNGSGDSTAVMEYSQLSPSGKIIVAAGQRAGTTGGQLQFINLLTGTTISQMTTQGSVLAISYDDAQYVSRAYTQGAATVLSDLNTHQILRVLPLTASSNEYWSTFGFSRDSRKLLGVSSAGANNPGGGRNARLRVFTVK